MILDLANGSPSLIRYLTDQICGKVFRHQEDLFTRNALEDRFVQIYAEEAHNYFPSKDTENTENTGIYARIAKEGAKYNIGLIYSTQSPSTISGELLSQTENFVVAHLDSAHEVDALFPISRVNSLVSIAQEPCGHMLELFSETFLKGGDSSD